MSDPRFTDQRFSDRPTDPNYIQPAPLRNENSGGVWGWVAGLAVVALIAFVVIAGWNNSSTNTASNPGASAPITTGSGPAVRDVTPPSTTGSGASSPSAPMNNPATPAAPPAPPAQQ